MIDSPFDLVVVGAGIVGLATTRAIQQRFPDLSVLLLETEDRIAVHQTGHNSGVLHSGLYYRPDSLKARLCTEGRQRLQVYCQEKDIAIKPTGKLVVATREEEIPRLQMLRDRGLANGLEDLEWLDEESIRRIEPEVRGLAGLRVGETGLVDYGEVSAALAQDLESGGVRLALGRSFISAQRREGEWRIQTNHGECRSARLLNCGGLYADRVAKACGEDPEVRIIPFRGEYHELSPAMAAKIKGPVYPVPDPQFPFLGVHLTPTHEGGVEAGPNAVLAFSREGYGWSTIRPRDLWEALAWPGLHHLARRHWRYGLGEMKRSLFLPAFTRELARLLPQIRGKDLRRGRSGVRAQAVTRQGALVDDFSVLVRDSAVHVINAVSPAATACLAIGDYIANLVFPETN